MPATSHFQPCLRRSSLLLPAQAALAPKETSSCYSWQIPRSLAGFSFVVVFEMSQPWMALVAKTRLQLFWLPLRLPQMQCGISKPTMCADLGLQKSLCAEGHCPSPWYSMALFSIKAPSMDQAAHMHISAWDRQHRRAPNLGGVFVRQEDGHFCREA